MCNSSAARRIEYPTRQTQFSSAAIIAGASHARWANGLKQGPDAERQRKMRTDKLQELKHFAAQLFSDRSQASTAAEPPRTTSPDQENASAVNGAAKPEFTATTPGAEGERGNETAIWAQPHSPLAGLDLEKAIHLRWVLRDIKGKRTKMSPVSPDDLRTLIEMNLVEMRDDIPALTIQGDRALD